MTRPNYVVLDKQGRVIDIALPLEHSYFDLLELLIGHISQHRVDGERQPHVLIVNGEIRTPECGLWSHVNRYRAAKMDAVEAALRRVQADFTPEWMREVTAP